MAWPQFQKAQGPSGNCYCAVVQSAPLLRQHAAIRLLCCGTGSAANAFREGVKLKRHPDMC